MDVVSSDQIVSLRLGMPGYASTEGTVGLCLNPDLLGRDFSCGRAWLVDSHSAQPKEVSTGDGELPLANDITGAEVWHQLSHRLLLGPRLQPNNAFCLCLQMSTPSLPFSLVQFVSKVALY